ncbi:MAG: high-potential iron-sulfur protein [Rhodocyclaceae bacterium]|nr:high-potential iron-sulfur protein [Rhodocyclaceae bacterium]
MVRRNISRRNLLKSGAAALAAIPVLVLSGRAFAGVNAALRASMKYQDKPQDGKSCAGCGQFIPGKPLGGCKIFPGDNEVSPQGWCVAWVAAPK